MYHSRVFNIANLSLNVIPENENIMKISEITVVESYSRAH